MNPTKVSNAVTTIWRNGDSETIWNKTIDRMNPATAPMILKARIRSASQPTGLPARRSFFSIRSRASSGVTRRASFPARDTIGTTTRLPKFSFSVSSRRLGAGAATPLGPTICVSSKRTARCFSARD